MCHKRRFLAMRTLKNGKYNGSIVLMILIVMTALVAIIHSMTRTVSYLVLLARDREAYELQHQENAKKHKKA